MDNVPDAYKVTDRRSKIKFKTHTFGGYKRNQVLAQWKKALTTGTLDKAVYWTVELDISGLIDTLWTNCIKYLSQSIGIKNPCLPHYLWKRYHFYIESKKRCDEMMLFRNNQESRNHLCEVVCVLALSDKQTLPSLPKIKDTDFTVRNIKSKMKCSHLTHIRDIVKIDDPRDFMIPINEIYYCISVGDKSSDTRDNCIYWLAWLYEYNKLYNKSNKCKCVARLVTGVEDKYTTDVMWIIWEVIFNCIKKMPTTQSTKEMYRQVTCLFYFYKHNFTLAKKTSRKCYIIHAILLCIDTIPDINYDQCVYRSYSTTVTSCMKINDIYYKLAKPRKVNQTFSEPAKKKKISPKINSMFTTNK